MNHISIVTKIRTFDFAKCSIVKQKKTRELLELVFYIFICSVSYACFPIACFLIKSYISFYIRTKLRIIQLMHLALNIFTMNILHIFQLYGKGWDVPIDKNQYV